MAPTINWRVLLTLSVRILFGGTDWCQQNVLKPYSEVLLLVDEDAAGGPRGGVAFAHCHALPSSAALKGLCLVLYVVCPLA